MNPMSIARSCVAALGIICVASTGAWAQPAPQRPPLRADLKAAAQRLADHPHPYGMSEEVARVRLEKLGYEKLQSIRPAGESAFRAEVTKNGQPQTVEIDRINGGVRAAQ